MIVLPSEDPSKLLKKIKKAIDDRRIKTWSYDIDGDFTQTADQWVGQAWLRPRLDDQRIILNIIPPKDTHISGAVYAVYHGRFIEMVIRHFDEEIAGNASVSPLPEGRDEVK